MALRNYSNTAVTTALVGGINSSDTSCVVGSTSGFPASTPYTLVLDFEAATQEVVEVTGVAGTTLTITRGVDNTSAQAHANAAVVVHAITKRDVAEPNTHIDASTNVHGLAGGAAVVGTTSAQTLTNKTMSGSSNTFTNVPGSGVDGTTFGKIIATAPAATDIPIVAKGAASQSANLMEVQNSAGTARFSVADSGNANVGARLTVNTDLVVGDQIIAGAGAVVAGEQMSVVVDDTNKGLVVNNTGAGTANSLEVQDNGSARIEVRKTGELVQSTGKVQLGSLAAVGSNKALVINDTAGGDKGLVVRGHASQSVNIFEVQNSTPTQQFAVNSSGTTVMGVATATSATIDTISDTVALTVRGHTSQTNNLLLIEKQDGTDLITVNNAGDLAVTGDLTVTGIRQVLFALKSADETVNNTTSLNSDDHLTLAPSINCTYILEAFVNYTSGTTPDFKFGWTFPAGATLTWTGGGHVVTGSSGAGDLASNVAHRLAADSTFSYGGGAAFVCGLQVKGLLIMGGTSGNLTARWAQATADASDTIVKADSWMRLTRVA